MKTLNKIYFLIVVLFSLFNYVLADVPQKISFQSVLRDSTNNILSDAEVDVKIEISKDSIKGKTVFAENFPKIRTNTNGFLSVEIGTGGKITGTLSGINWNDGPYYVRTLITISPNQVIEGGSQLISVPYALHSSTADKLTIPFKESDTLYWKPNNYGIRYKTGNVIIGNKDSSTVNLHVEGSIIANGGMYYVSGPLQGNYPTDAENSLIYGSRNGGSGYPFTNSGHLILQSVTTLDRDIIFVTGKTPSPKMNITSSGNVGIGTMQPARKLHVTDAMRLEPIPNPPQSPSKGDMYFDSTLNKLRVYDGSVWQNCW